MSESQFPTIQSSDLIEIKNRLIKKNIPTAEFTEIQTTSGNGKQRRALKNKQMKDSTVEFLKNAIFSPSKINQYRTRAFELLSNKEENAKRLVKTKLCRNILEHGECKRKICHFAHNGEELNDPPCAFGDNCRRKNMCKFKHPQESTDKYRKRCNIIIPSIPEPTKSVPPSEPHSPNENETVIQYSQEFAEEAMLKAIESGAKNIRFEVV